MESMVSTFWFFFGSILHDGLGNFMLCALDGQNAGQLLARPPFGKEGNRLKAGLGFGGAAHKGGIVVQAVIVHQIAEREAVAEQNGFITCCIHGSLIVSVSGQPAFHIRIRIGCVSILVIGVKLL